jgi:hypothetical protein
MEEAKKENLPITKKHLHWYIKNRQPKKYDLIILIAGDKRQGKTTIAKITHEFSSLENKIPDFQNYFVVGLSKFNKVMSSTPERCTFTLDETADILSSNKYSTTLASDIRDFFHIGGEKSRIAQLIIQMFTRLDPDIKQMIDLLIYVKTRGECYVFPKAIVIRYFLKEGLKEHEMLPLCAKLAARYDNIFDTYDDYEGILNEGYAGEKQERITDVQNRFNKKSTLSENKTKKELGIGLIRLKEFVAAGYLHPVQNKLTNKWAYDVDEVAAFKAHGIPKEDMRKPDDRLPDIK